MNAVTELEAAAYEERAALAEWEAAGYSEGAGNYYLAAEWCVFELSNGALSFGRAA